MIGLTIENLTVFCSYVFGQEHASKPFFSTQYPVSLQVWDCLGSSIAAGCIQKTEQGSLQIAEEGSARISQESLSAPMLTDKRNGTKKYFIKNKKAYCMCIICVYIISILLLVYIYIFLLHITYIAITILFTLWLHCHPHWYGDVIDSSM